MTKGLAATANTAQKIEDFLAAFGGLRAYNPNAHPSNELCFTFTDTQSIVPGTEKFWAACRFLERTFSIIVKKCRKIGSTLGSDL